MGLLKSVSKAVKSITNTAKKAVSSSLDFATGGAFSQATGADSWLNDISKSLTGNNYFDTSKSVLGNILGGNNILSGIAGNILNNNNSVFSAKNAKEMALWNSELQYQYQTKLNQQAQDYDREMANTAIQRRVEDLKAANLNPILAATEGAGGGGLSGGAAQPSQADWMNYQLQAQAAQRDAQRVEIERSNSASSARLMAAQEQKTLADMTETIKRLPYVSKSLEAQISNIMAGTVKANAETARAQAETEKIRAGEWSRLGLPIGEQISNIFNTPAKGNGNGKKVHWYGTRKDGK